VVVVEGPTPPRRRLTITPPVIAAARHVAVLVAGEAKAATVARALESDASASEIPAVLARHGVWFLDRAAAARLARPVP
jgi:6-phosphogluconolactonase